MYRFSLFTPLAFSLVLLFSACGDVGDAPQAQTGDAVAVTASAGEALPIDTAQSEINWKAAKVTRAHDGGFHAFEGSITVADGAVTGVAVTIDMNSVWTDTDRLTGHLKNEDFFEVETYPTATFEASDIVSSPDSTGATHLVTGNLTMHGETHGVTFPATLNVTDQRVDVAADFIINRRDWNINYDGRADDLVEDQVRMLLNIVAAPAAEAGV